MGTIPSIPPTADNGAPSVDPDPAAIRWWLHHLYDRCDPTGWVVASVNPSGGGKWRENVHAFTVGDRREAVDKLADLARGGCLYLTCCPRTERPAPGHRGGAGTVGTLPGFWADLDVAGPRHAAAASPHPPTDAVALELAHEVGRPPSLYIHSGGGIQAWWLLDEPLVIDDTNRDEVGDLVRGWGRTMGAVGALRGYHVDEVGDLPRVLRPAGTGNFKPEKATGLPLPPVAVEVGDVPDVPTRYSLDELSALIVPEVPTTPPRSPRPPDHPPPPPGVPDGPAELLAALPWSDILGPLGWSFVGMANIPPHGMAEQWLRPGSTSHHSGNFWPSYGTIHSDAAGTTRTGKAESKLTIYAELYHGGSTEAAGEAVYAEARNRWAVAR